MPAKAPDRHTRAACAAGRARRAAAQPPASCAASCAGGWAILGRPLADPQLHEDGKAIDW